MKNLSATLFDDARDLLSSDIIAVKVERVYSNHSTGSTLDSTENNNFFSDWTFTKLEPRVIQNNLVRFENWQGYISLVADDYFEAIVKNHSSVKHLRISKNRLKNGETLFINQIVCIKVKYYQEPTREKKKRVVEMNLDQPLNRTSEMLESIVSEKIKHLSYMFEEYEEH